MTSASGTASKLPVVVTVDSEPIARERSLAMEPITCGSWMDFSDVVDEDNENRGSDDCWRPRPGHVHVPQLRRPGDAERAGSAPARRAAATLDELVLTHHAQDPLAVDRLAELTARDHPDDAVAVGRVLRGDPQDRRLYLIGRRPALRSRSQLRSPVSCARADRCFCALHGRNHGQATIPWVPGDQPPRAGGACQALTKKPRSPLVRSSDWGDARAGVSREALGNGERKGSYGNASRDRLPR